MQRGKMLGFVSERGFLMSVLFSSAWLMKK